MKSLITEEYKILEMEQQLEEAGWSRTPRLDWEDPITGHVYSTVVAWEVHTERKRNQPLEVVAQLKKLHAQATPGRWTSNCGSEIFATVDGRPDIRIGHFQGCTVDAEAVCALHNQADLLLNRVTHCLPADAVLAMVRKLLNLPFAQICRHQVAADLLSALEEQGFKISPELAKAVVSADDNTATQLLDAVAKKEACPTKQ